jgi:hypothetical protein
MIYLDQAGGGAGQPGVLQLTAKNGNQLTLLNPAPPGTIPPADATQPGLLNKLSGLVSDFVGGDNACRNVVAAIPLADSTKAGLLAKLSGNTSDYVGGDNNSHALPLQVSANYANLGGLLIQWGHLSPSGTTTVTFPVAYSSTAPFVFVSPDGYYNSADLGTTSLLGYGVGRPTTTNFVVYPRYVNAGGGVGVAAQAFFWLAIGPA